MAPQFPWQRTNPSTSPSLSSSASASASSRSALLHASNISSSRTTDDTPVVISASGRSAFSPSGAALAAGVGSGGGSSSSTAGGGGAGGFAPDASPGLRIRNSPRTGVNGHGSANGAFGSQRDSYPAPSTSGARQAARSGASAAGVSSGSGSGSGSAGQSASSRVRTIFGRRRKNSDTIALDSPVVQRKDREREGLDVQISPAGTPGAGRAGEGYGGGGWSQLAADSPGSSISGGANKTGLTSTSSSSSTVPIKRFDARGYPTRDDLKGDATGTGAAGGSAVGSPSKLGQASAAGRGKVGSGEGESAASRYAYTSRQSFLGGSSATTGQSVTFTQQAHQQQQSASQSLYPPTVPNYSLSSPSYSPSAIGPSATSSSSTLAAHGPPAASQESQGAEGTGRRKTGRGGRADYFATTASVLSLGGYEDVRTPSDDEGLYGYAQGPGAAVQSHSQSNSRNGSLRSFSGSGSGTGMGMLSADVDKYTPTHYDGYNYARSITGTMRTARTGRSESGNSEVTMGSRAHLGRYDALQAQFERDRDCAGPAGGSGKAGKKGGEGEGYEYGVGGMVDDYGAFSVGSRGGKKHLGQIFSLPPDPTSWSYLGPEADDELHDPDIKPRGRTGFMGSMVTMRGAGNVGCLAFLCVVLVGMFAVYPITSQFLSKGQPTYGAYNLGGINATGQIPDIGHFQLIDRDTPSSAYTHTSFETGETWDLVFSDEFNRDGRTFWPGDDPFWEAQDLHYWQTNNKEWYHPTMVTTVGGSLRITLTNEKMNGLNYTGGMINSWNRFCFTGGYVEASVSLPGKNNVYGLWPAIWSLGNLGRAGYGGTLDGVWPYSYDTCDVGTLHNQTLNGQPRLAPGTGDKNNHDHLSYLPGQRLSRCTCANDPTHPGPKHADGTWVGRSAPEIDMFEAVIDSDTITGEVSQSAQWAPFDPYYQFVNKSTAQYEVYNNSMTYINPWLGSVWQQATTALSYTDPNCYTQETGCYSKYGYEYAPGNDGYVTWLSDNRVSWTVRAAAMGPNAVTKVGQRPVPQEPMYLLLNLGLSENFGPVDYEGLEKLFPVHMDVDYIRVYQDPKQHNIGCDPPDFPTQSYINRFMDVYTNPNITVMGQIQNFTVPRNTLIDTC